MILNLDDFGSLLMRACERWEGEGEGEGEGERKGGESEPDRAFEIRTG